VHAIDMHSRVATLDSGGNAVVGVPPCRWAGCFPDDGSLTIHNMGRTLTSSGEVLPPAEQLVSGDITVAGPPDSEAVLFFRWANT
jgi:hypothetical protein